MAKKIFDTDEKTELLAQVDLGMPVYGSEGEKVGKVDKIHLGHSLPEKEPSATEKLNQDLTPSQEIAATFAQMVETLFDPQDEIEEVVQKRLYQHGFIRIDAKGLLAGDRYVLADDIETVKNGEVHLSLKRDEIFSD
jgi:hypothetical protein